MEIEESEGDMQQHAPAVMPIHRVAVDALDHQDTLQ